MACGKLKKGEKGAKGSCPETALKHFATGCADFPIVKKKSIFYSLTN